MSQMSGDGANSPSKKPTILSQNQLYRLSGGYNTELNNVATIYNTRLSPTETISNIRRVHVKQETADTLDQQSLTSFVQPSFEKTTRIKFDNKRFRALAPEIENAALILVSSILSPNDLQNNGLLFDINHDKLTDTVKEEIIKEIEDYFNEKYDIGNKLAEWIKECLFGCGSQPVLVMPDFKFDELKNSNNAIALESLDRNTLPALQDELSSIINVPIYTSTAGYGIENFKLPISPKDLLTFAHENRTTEEDIRFKTELIDPIMNTLNHELYSELNHLFPIIKSGKDAANKNIDISKARAKFLDELAIAVEDTTIKITTKMNDGDMFRITENPEILRFHNKFSIKRKYDLSNRLEEFFNSDNKNYRIEPVAAITEESADDGQKSKTFPTTIVLPPESVVPICIPGDKKSHIGYFIINDQYGHPIVGEEPIEDNTNCGSGYGSAAFDTLFSTRSMRSLGSLTNGSRSLVVSKVFEHILDKYLKSKMANIGLGDMDVAQLNSVTQVMLNRLMYHKQTVLLFVPEPYITYYAFDYRSDGTGKGKLEDAAFILHLRTVYLMAKIIAMQKNAVPGQTVSFDITDKTADPEQLIEYMRNVFVSGATTVYDANPTTIHQTMYDKGLRFIPKNGYPGLENFTVESDSDGSRVDGPDDSIGDTLNTLWVDFLDVPHSALNLMGENEYSRSILTNHVFFSKKVIGYQDKLEVHNNKLIRSIVRYAKPLRDSISEILNKDGSSTDSYPSASGGSTSSITVDSVINAICTSLPTPKIAPDKALFNEISDYLESIDKVVDRMISSDMIPDGDTSSKDAIDRLKAYYKAKMTKQFAKVVGVDTVLDLPDMENTLEAQSGMLTLYTIAKNLSQMFKSAETAHDVNKQPENEFVDDSGGMSGMGDDGFGDMGGGDMSGDMGMDMGDMSMDDGGMDSSPDMGDTSTPDTSSDQNNDSQTFNIDFDNPTI